MLDPTHPIAELLRRDKRYHFEAYLFVFQALRFAQQELGMGAPHPTESEEGDDEPERHVTGQELCEAMRQYAHQEYGYLAKCVLNEWGIGSTGDFGEVDAVVGGSGHWEGATGYIRATGVLPAGSNGEGEYIGQICTP